MTRSVMNEKDISHTYWVETIHTTIHVLNKAYLRPNNDKNPYELWFGRPASIKIVSSLEVNAILKIMMNILENMMAGPMKVFS